MIDEFSLKLMDYGVLGIVLYIILNRVIAKLDEIERCLKELRVLLQGLSTKL
jgi:hypothetical protein